MRGSARTEPGNNARKRRAIAWVVGLVVGLAGVVAVGLLATHSARFVLGGALINLGYRMQDPLQADLQGRPIELWSDVLARNQAAARVREIFPRTVYDPAVAIVACMDARLDTNELVGDTRRYYYVIRLAGSVMSEREAEMLELAVEHGVRVIVHTTHTECAAEHVAHDSALRVRYPRTWPREWTRAQPRDNASSSAQRSPVACAHGNWS